VFDFKCININISSQKTINLHIHPTQLTTLVDIDEGGLIMPNTESLITKEKNMQLIISTTPN
jgi:hypothetical protein